MDRRVHLWFARVYFVASAGIAVAAAYHGVWPYLLMAGFSMVGAISIGYLLVRLDQEEITDEMLTANLESCWRRVFLDEFGGLSDAYKDRKT